MTLLLMLLLAAALCGLVYVALLYQKARTKAASHKAELESQLEKAEASARQLSERAGALEAENRGLAKWKVVADADVKAAELLLAAQTALDGAKAEASRQSADATQQATAVAEAAKTEARAATAEAKERAKSLVDSARADLDAATAKAAEIVDAANKRAEEIAGDAYKAKNKADLYERAAQAMKNLIEGYGDRYLIPSHSLLDGLAEEFGHTQAGEELKRARELSRAMVQGHTAATCLYVEANRRETAIEFVVDAFNGKVDSVLSRVKHDNAGTLAREIRDAFDLVNFNGSAFRQAKITEEYLAARLEELKWAAIAQQLKLDEREEQRRIREQIREEEKARREYERAMRDAEKEEEMLRKAMQKAQERVEQANAEERAKFESQLQDLSVKLSEAEERNQSAKSMAEQTRRGHVYIISNVGSFGEHVYKIGLTRRLEPVDRIRELGDSSVPFEFDIHAMIFSEDAPALETRLHNHFLMMQMNKVNYRKEFFRVDLAHIREEVTKFGLDVKWTMAAEAREYRETLAIEEAIKADPSKRDAWAKGQLDLPPPSEIAAAVNEEPEPAAPPAGD